MKKFIGIFVVLAVLGLVPIMALAQTTVQTNAAGTTRPTAQVNLPVRTTVPFYYSVPTTQLDTTNDIIQLVNVCEDCRLIELLISCADFDTNATPALTFDVGYGAADAATEDDIFANSTVCQTGGTITLRDDGDHSTNFRSAVSTREGLFQFTVADTIDLYIETVAGTAAAGTIAGYAEFEVEPD